MAKTTFKDFLNSSLKDLKVELVDEFDRNFERKAFFDRPWKETKYDNHIGSLMMRAGDLRRGMTADIESGVGVRFTNSMPYAVIHNEGGETHPRVTPLMRAWAWRQFKETGEAFYKSIALTKKETLTVKIDARPFIGHHPEVDNIVTRIVDDNIQEAFDDLFAQMQREARG